VYTVVHTIDILLESILLSVRNINKGEKLGCYCGVAPFEYSSGSSKRGTTKVHFITNKKLKSNLQMASLTAIKLDDDFKRYYERKCAERKNKMSLLNAVRNKLLARVLACVNNGETYVNKAAQNCRSSIYAIKINGGNSIQQSTAF
jgi:transposase